MFERLKSLKKVVFGRLIAPVPSDVAVCEFDCRETSCSPSDWEACERRRNSAGGLTSTASSPTEG